MADEARLRERQHLAFQSAARAHTDALAPDGPLAARKVFARRHVVVAVAPKLFGLDPSLFPKVVDRVLADPEAVALLPTDGARHRVWATATTIATEQAVAASVARQVDRTDAPAVHEVIAHIAVGTHFTVGQRAAVMGIATSGRGADLVVGVAGSGKTTALAAVRKAFESEGFEVIGTSTSGQAARTLASQAGIEASRTLASLTWRLDHGSLSLTDRHVVICDEASMTDDADLLRLLEAAAEARAKLVLVGDHRQLGRWAPVAASRPWWPATAPPCTSWTTTSASTTPTTLLHLLHFLHCVTATLLQLCQLRAPRLHRCCTDARVGHRGHRGGLGRRRDRGAPCRHAGLAPGRRCQPQPPRP